MTGYVNIVICIIMLFFEINHFSEPHPRETQYTIGLRTLHSDSNADYSFSEDFKNFNFTWF